MFSHLTCVHISIVIIWACASDTELNRSHKSLPSLNRQSEYMIQWYYQSFRVGGHGGGKWLRTLSNRVRAMWACPCFETLTRRNTPAHSTTAQTWAAWNRCPCCTVHTRTCVTLPHLHAPIEQTKGCRGTPGHLSDSLGVVHSLPLSLVSVKRFADCKLFHCICLNQY